MNKTRMAVIILTKNEEKNIERCLKCLAPYNFEIVVVDTGSVDRTKEIALRYTTQVFDFDLLRGALTKAIEDNTAITDDCSAVEALGMSVYLTKGSDENIKITTPTDLILAKAILEGRE